MFKERCKGKPKGIGGRQLRFIEIRLSNGLLLVGSPGAFPGVMNKAADQQQLRSVLRSFPRNSAAMGQLRKQWRRLYPAQSSTTLPSQEMVRLLNRELAATRLAAAFLRDAPCNIEEAKFDLGSGQVVHVSIPGATLLIASKGQLPPEFNRYRNSRGGADMLRQIAQNDPAAAAIDNQAARACRAAPSSASPACRCASTWPGQSRAARMTARYSNTASPLVRRRPAPMPRAM